MKVTVCGRVADPRLKKVQGICARWIRDTLKELPGKGRFEVTCMGSVVYRVHPESLRTLPSSFFPNLIWIEVWPRDSDYRGVLYIVASPEGTKVPVVLDHLQQRTVTYPDIIT